MVLMGYYEMIWMASPYQFRNPPLRCPFGAIVSGVRTMSEIVVRPVYAAGGCSGSRKKRRDACTRASTAVHEVEDGADLALHVVSFKVHVLVTSFS